VGVGGHSLGYPGEGVTRVFSPARKGTLWTWEVVEGVGVRDEGGGEGGDDTFLT